MSEAQTDDVAIVKPSLLRHFMAMVYDILLIAPILMASQFVLLLFFGPTADATVATVPTWLTQMLAVLVIAVFFTIFWRKSGQTLGMQAWRIKLQTLDDQKLTVLHCLKRVLGAALSFATVGLGYLWRYVDSNNRYLHDRLSGTELVLLPKEKKKKA